MSYIIYYGGTNIWLPLNRALEKYRHYNHLITASNYITPFNVVSERDVKENFNISGPVTIFSKTPSIGGSWPTHPSLKYLSSQDDIHGESSVFSKVSSESNVQIERENLIKMSSRLPVPNVFRLFRNREDDLPELREMKPGCQVAAVLVEEFIDSISLGHAIIEERIDIDMVDEVLITLKKMHEFCVHRDLKHSHIRINLDPRTCELLTQGLLQDTSLEIKGISIIDVETTKMREEFDPWEFEAHVKTDITQLLTSVTGYMGVLEHDSELIRGIFPTPLNKRLKRFAIFLDAIRGEYLTELPHHFLSKSKTARFLTEKLNV